MQLLLFLLALVAGALMPIQAGINARLGTVANGVLPAAFISFLVGTVALGAVLLATGQGIPWNKAWAASPWWYWIGGTLGAFFVAATVVLAPRIGAGAMVAFTLTGQLAASMLLDHFGLLGFPHIAFDGKRLLGVGLLAVGVYLIRF